MPHFAFGITQLSDGRGGIGLIVAWNRFDIEAADVDDYPDGAGLYATTHLVDTRQRLFVRSKSPISIPAKDCPVNLDGYPPDGDESGTRDLVVVFRCIPQDGPTGPRAAIALDFYEKDSLIYSVAVHGDVTAVLRRHRLDRREIVIRDRLVEQPFYDELEGLNLPTPRARTGRSIWEDLMTPGQIPEVGMKRDRSRSPARFCSSLTDGGWGGNRAGPRVGLMSGSPTWRVPTDSDESGEVSVTLLTRLGLGEIRDWDQLVNQTQCCDVSQLSAWAAVRRQAGYLPCYVLARSAGQLAGGALILQRRLPVLGIVGYVPHGPVIAPGPARPAVVHAVCTVLAKLGRQHVSGLFIQPPEGADDVSDCLLQLGFRPSVAGIAPAASIRIDLTRDVENIRGGLNSGNRRRTRTGADRGVTVRLGDERDLPLLADLLARSAAHQHFDPPSLGYLRTLYRELDQGDHVKVFIAELAGDPAAAELFTGCGGVLKSRLAGIRRPVRAPGAAAAVVWHAVLWAKANGYHTFDFGGVPLDSVETIREHRGGRTAGLAGPEVFKASFEGRAFRYPPAVELLSSRLLRTGYDLSRRSATGHQVVAVARRLMHGGGQR